MYPREFGKSVTAYFANLAKMYADGKLSLVDYVTMRGAAKIFLCGMSEDEAMKQVEEEVRQLEEEKEQKENDER